MGFSAAQGAVISVSVDGVDASQQQINGLSQSMTGLANTIQADQINIVAAINRTTMAMQSGGTQTAAYYEMLGKARGIDPNVLAPYIAQLRAVEQEQAAAGHSTEEFGFKTAAAKRELLVLTHELSQGNFKKFGGSMLVIAEQTGAAGMLFSAAGLGAIGLGAAIFGVGAAMVKGAEQQKAMNDALIMTGGYAGVTSDSLNAMAQAAVATGGSIGVAKEAVTALAGSGKFTAAQIGTITDAAVAMEHATGQSVEKTIEQFQSLAVQTSGDTLRSTEAISKAALKLDDQYHFLTESIYEQIRAYEKEGDQKAASALATDTLSKVTKDRADEIIANLGYVATAWHAVTKAIGGAIDAVGDFGKKATPGIQVDKASNALANFDRMTAADHKRNGLDPDKLNADEARQRAKIVQDLTTAIIAKNNADAAAIAQGGKARAESEAMHAASRIEQDDIKQQKKGMTELQVAIQEYGQDLAKIAAVNPTSALLGQDAVNAHMAALVKAHTKAATGTDARAQVLQDQITIEQTALESEKSIYDARDKMLDTYHSKFGLSDAEFYAGRQAARTEYLAAEAITFAKESSLLQAAAAQAKNPQEVAAAKARYDELLKGHQKFVDDMRNAGGADTTAEAAAIQKSYDDIAQTVADSDAATLKSLDDQIAKQREHNAEIGKTKDQIDLARQAQEDLHTAQLQSDADYLRDGLAKWDMDDKSRAIYQLHLSDLDAEIAKRAEISTLLGDASIKDADAKAASDAAAAWKKSANTINNDLVNAIVDGGGKGAKKLIHDMEAAFARMVLQPILAPISADLATSLSPFMGSQTIGSTDTAGATAAAGSSNSASLIGAAQMASGLYKAVSGGLASINATISTSVADAVQATMYSTGMTSQIASNSAFATSAGSVASSAGGALAGHYIGNAIAGDYSVAHGQTVTNIASVVGAVIGGPIGGAIGGAIGGLINRAFGMGSTEVQSQGMSGTLTANSLTGTDYEKLHQDGGWFRSDKNWTTDTPFDTKTVAQFTQGLAAIEQASSGFAKNLGVDAGWVSTYSKTFDVALTGDATKDAQAVTDFFSGIGDELATKLVPNLASFEKTGETASATLERLAGDFTTTDQAAQLLGTSSLQLFGATGLASADARERLVGLAGGVSTLAQQAQYFSENFLTDAERIAPVSAALDAALGSLGLATIPTTRDEFKGLVDDLINSGAAATAAGAAQLESLLSLEEPFAQVHPQIDATAAAVNAAADALQAMQDAASGLLGDVDSAFTVLQNVAAREKAALQTRIDAETALIGKTQALSDALHGALDGMSAAGQGAADRAAAQAQIKSALASVRAGSGLPDADTLKGALATISQQQGQFATYQDYLRDFYSTQNDIAGLAQASDGTLSTEQQTLDTLNAQSKQYDDMLASEQAMIDELKGQSSTLLSIDQAMQGVDSAILAARANPLAASTSAITDAYQSALGRAPDAAGLAYYQNAVAGGASTSAVVGAITASPEAQIQSLYHTLLGRTADAAGLDYYLHSGESMSQIAADMKSSTEYKTLHPFAIGTNYIPEDMPALVHQGERIIPAADNRELMRRLASPTANSDALAAAVTALRKEVEGLRAEARATAGHTEKTSRLLKRAMRTGNTLSVSVEAP